MVDLGRKLFVESQLAKDCFDVLRSPQQAAGCLDVLSVQASGDLEIRQVVSVASNKQVQYRVVVLVAVSSVGVVNTWAHSWASFYGFGFRLGASLGEPQAKTKKPLNNSEALELPHIAVAGSDDIIYIVTELYTVGISLSNLYSLESN